MGIELELIVLLAISVVDQSVFARFELETPAWRKIFKWSIVVAGTLGLYAWIGHWSLMLPLLAGAGGRDVPFHLVPAKPHRSVSGDAAPPVLRASRLELASCVSRS